MRTILEEQYVLARKCNMSPKVTNMMPDFEREIFVNLLMRDMAEEKKAMES